MTGSLEIRREPSTTMRMYCLIAVLTFNVSVIATVLESMRTWCSDSYPSLRIIITVSRIICPQIPRILRNTCCQRVCVAPQLNTETLTVEYEVYLKDSTQKTRLVSQMASFNVPSLASWLWDKQSAHSTHAIGE